MLVNAISPNTKNNISFKSALTPEDKVNIMYTLQKEATDEFIKNETVSLAVGAGAGLVSLAAGKVPYIAMAAGYLATSGVLSANQAVKNAKKSKEFYANYEKDNENKNVFDKIMSTLAAPRVIDLKDEEKNKEYYETYKKENLKGAKLTIAIIATSIIAAAIFLVKTIKR